ncbi:tRNA nucleotidyltransferase CCA-adding enzyme protein, partial [Marine Group I thaumarchaeote SCGC RSA3]
MSIIEFSNKPISIIKNSTISDAIKMLLNTKISRLIVNDGGKHVGIITEKDIGLFLFSETTKRGLEEIPVTEIMRPIEFVDQDVTPKNAAKIMIEKGISSLSIGEEQEVKAIVTKSDLVKYFARRLSDKNKVADVMT